MPPYKERLKQLEINMKNEGGELPSMESITGNNYERNKV